MEIMSALLRETRCTVGEATKTSPLLVLWQIAVSRRTCQNLLGLCGHAVHSLLFWQQGQSHDTPYYPRAREERICEHHFSRIKDRFRGTPSLKQGLLGTFRTHLTQMKAGIPSPERFGVLKLLDFFSRKAHHLENLTHQERYRVFKRLEKRMSWQLNLFRLWCVVLVTFRWKGKWKQHWNSVQQGLCRTKRPVRKLGVIYFPTNWGAREPQNLPNHRVVIKMNTKHDGL